jgi:hypothetical protein
MMPRKGSPVRRAQTGCKLPNYRGEWAESTNRFICSDPRPFGVV